MIPKKKITTIICKLPANQCYIHCRVFLNSLIKWQQWCHRACKATHRTIKSHYYDITGFFVSGDQIMGMFFHSQGQRMVLRLKRENPFFEGMYCDNKGQISMRACRSVFEGQEISCLFFHCKKKKSPMANKENKGWGGKNSMNIHWPVPRCVHGS